MPRQILFYLCLWIPVYCMGENVLTQKSNMSRQILFYLCLWIPVYCMTWKCANTEKQHAKQTHCKNIFAFLLRYIDFKLLLIYYWINFFKKLTLNLFLFFNKRFRNRISYFLLHKVCNFFLHNRPINMFFKFLKYSFGYGIFFTLVLDLNMYDCTCTNEPSLFLYE